MAKRRVPRRRAGAAPDPSLGELSGEPPPPPPCADVSCVEYVALVAAGLDALAVDEIASRLSLPHGAVRVVGTPPVSAQWVPGAKETQSAVFAGTAGVAKLRFTLPRPADAAGWAAQHASLAALPCTCGLLAPLAFRSGVPLTAAGLEVAYAAAASCGDRWEAAVQTWRGCRPAPLEDDEDDEAGSLSFRATAVRDGTHAYKSPALAEAVGAAVYTSRGLRVALRGFDLEVLAIQLQGELLLGINLWGTGARGGGGGGGGGGGARSCDLQEPRPLMHRAETTASLRPSTAWLMLRLARVRRGDVVIDPMCGIGTIPLVAAAMHGAALALSGDVDADVVEQAAVNGAALAASVARSPSQPGGFLEMDVRGAVAPWHVAQRKVPRADVGGAVAPCVWSATELPLRAGTVDAAVIDLPFGVVHKVRGGGGGLKALYGRALIELARVVRTGGRLVTLSTSRRSVCEPLELQAEGSAALWRPTEALPVNCGGALAWVCAWERTAAPFVAAPPHGTPEAAMRPTGTTPSAAPTAAMKRAQLETAARRNASGALRHGGEPRGRASRGPDAVVDAPPAGSWAWLGHMLECGGPRESGSWCVGPRK